MQITLHILSKVKRLFLLFICIIFFDEISKGQIIIPLDSTKNIYKPLGIIYNEYPNKHNSESRKKTNLTITEVLKAESLFFEKYRYIEMLSPLNSNINAKEVCKKYFHYARQYYGFIDLYDSKFVIIQLLNFNVSKRDKRNFYPDWEKHYITGYGGFFETNTIRFLVNLTNEKVDIW